MLDKPTLKINGEEVIIKYNGDTIKFKDEKRGSDQGEQKHDV